MSDKYFLCTKKVVHVENCLSLIKPKVCIVIIDSACDFYDKYIQHTL